MTGAAWGTWESSCGAVQRASSGRARLYSEGRCPIRPMCRAPSPAHWWTHAVLYPTSVSAPGAQRCTSATLCRTTLHFRHTPGTSVAGGGTRWLVAGWYALLRTETGLRSARAVTRGNTGTTSENQGFGAVQPPDAPQQPLQGLAHVAGQAECNPTAHNISQPLGLRGYAPCEICPS